jgi:beta-1,4-N-acetylglucosaminyltransferase
MIVVPNASLLDNHQEDLAKGLSALGHLRSSSVRYVAASTLHPVRYTSRDSDLPDTIIDMDVSTLMPFPAFDGTRFQNLLDETMGYV